MFEDVFGPLDDVLKDTPAEDWDTGECWDSGEKENIWRAEPAATPGVVWTTGSGGCGSGGCDSCDDECETDCDDDCVDDHGVDEDPPEEQATLGGPVAPDTGGLSESEQLDEFDDELEMSEEDEDLGTPTGVFDDIF